MWKTGASCRKQVVTEKLKQPRVPNNQITRDTHHGRSRKENHYIEPRGKRKGTRNQLEPTVSEGNEYSIYTTCQLLFTTSLHNLESSHRKLEENAILDLDPPDGFKYFVLPRAPKERGQNSGSCWFISTLNPLNHTFVVKKTWTFFS